MYKIRVRARSRVRVSFRFGNRVWDPIKVSERAQFMFMVSGTLLWVLDSSFRFLGLGFVIASLWLRVCDSFFMG